MWTKKSSFRLCSTFSPPFRNILLFLTLRIFLSGLPSDSGFCHTPSSEHRHRDVGALLWLLCLTFSSSQRPLLCFACMEIIQRTSFQRPVIENCYLHTCLCTHSNTPCLPSCPCCRLHKGRDSDCWALFLMSLVPTTQCLSVVASYNGHVIGTSLGKRKFVIISLLCTLWCNNSRRRLLRVRQICLLDNGLHLPSSPSLIGGGRLCTINRCETNKTPLSFPDGISNTPLSYWPYLAMLTK